MSKIWVKEFTGGLDSRRDPETMAGGVLLKGNDGHITRGGDFEKRAAFVPVYTLPAGQTVGLGWTPAGIVVYGGGVTPGGIPAGVTYQRLQSPGGANLVKVPSWTLYKGQIYAAGLFDDGTVYHYYNGARVTDWYDGRARSYFTVTGGTNGASTINIAVGGVNIMAGAVTYTTDNSTTAAAIAAAINSQVSSPDYTATAVDNRVNILASVAGSAANGRSVVLTLASGFTASPNPPATLAGGADGTLAQPGSFVQTYGSRIISVSGSVLFGSSINQPTKWNTDNVGAFFIDMSSQTFGAEALHATARYQTFEAVFADRSIQTWFFDSDPTNNKINQELSNTGTASGKSVTQFGDNDIFYLDESGIRSVRARYASTAASTSDIGVPIDTLVQAQIQTLSDEDRTNVVGLIEPQNGRVWMIMNDIIYVFSYFPGAKVSAWSTYTPGFEITDAVVFNRRVYVRSGDTIYCYGGISGPTVYDGTIAEAWTPYFDGEEPTRKKTVNGIDVAGRGLWEVYIATRPLDLTQEERVGQIVGTTYGDNEWPALGEATHISLRFRSVGTGPGRISACVIHYDGHDDED